MNSEKLGVGPDSRMSTGEGSLNNVILSLLGETREAGFGCPYCEGPCGVGCPLLAQRSE